MTTSVDAFGTSMIFDRTNGFVILSVKNMELAHFINSAMLDTATHLMPNRSMTRFIGLKPGTEIILLPNKAELTTAPPPEGLLAKRARAELLRRGYWFLLEQATLIETSFDGFDHLTSADLPLFLANREPYVTAYASTAHVSVELAEKHLDFLAKNLMACHARKKQLMLKYSLPLRLMETEVQYTAWFDELYNEVIGLGKI